MKKTILKNYLAAFALMFGFTGMYAQNLVLNPSFEAFTPAPVVGCAGSGYGNVTNWYNPDLQDSCSTPDWYSNCTTLLGATPNANFGYQQAHSGNAYAGIILKDQSTNNYREYVEGKLTSPLVAGQTYCVAFNVSLGNKAYLYCNNFGMYLSNTLTQYPTNYCKTAPIAPLPVTPQLNYTCTIKDTANWIRVQWSYTAVGGEQYFTIGNFFNDAATTSGVNNASGLLTGPFAYYYIDDVSIAAGTCCYDSIKQQAPLCSTASTVTLTTDEVLASCITPTVSGVWSGTGITNATTGIFDPSVAGIGTHVVSYSLSCGYVATTSISVISCPLTVCKDVAGDLTVSGGTAPYNWYSVTTYTDCSGCPGGNCIPLFCSGVTSTSLTPIASNTATISSPSSYPVIVKDNAGSSYTVTSSASTPVCTTTTTPCPTITVSTVASNSVTCFGASTGSATVSVSPAGTYTCTWQPGNLTGLSQTGLAAGIYTVTADAGGGCTGTTTLSITQPSAALSASITVSPATCGLSNGSATVTATGGTSAYSYTWSPAGGSSTTASNLSAGVYTVTVKDANSCTVTATKTISSTSAPTVSVNNVTLCTSSTSTLTASGATTYSWSPATGLSSTTGATVTATPTTTAIYTVTGSSAGCTATATISVSPQQTFTVNKAVVCKGDSVLLIASNSSLNYTWTPSSGLNTTSNDTVKASPSATTVYTVTGTHGTCSLTVTDSVIVNLKPVVTVLSPTVCSATSATITAAGASTYTWLPASNLSTSVTSDTAYVNFPTTPGTYTVVGSLANGCKDTAVSHVTISNHLGIVSATPNFRCYGDFINLLAVGASTYTWTSNDPVNLNFNPSTGYSVVTNTANVGTYTIAIYGESHTGTYCNGYDTITLTIHPTPTITPVGNTSFTVCAGNSATLTVTSIANSASSYTWSPAAGLSSTTNTVTVASPAATTVYTVTGENAFGCSDVVTYTVTVIPIPTFNLSSASICIGNSATLTATPITSAPATYTWSPSGSLNTNTGTTVVANPSATTIYTVNATTIVAGCHSLPQTTTVTVHNLPVIAVTPTSTTICSGTTAGLSATNGLSVYNWSPSTSIVGSSNTSAVLVDPSSTTAYTVSAMDAFGCLSNTVTAAVNVTAISASASANPVCKGQTISLIGNTLNGASYAWTGPNGFTSSSQNPGIPNAALADSGKYVLTVTHSSCVATATVTVKVNPLPVVTVSSPQTVCPNAPAVYTASGAATYTWTPSTGLSASTGSMVTATTTVTTNYTVTGTDLNGCNALASTTVIINPVTAVISANPATGDIPLSVEFGNTTSGGTSYTWNYGNGSATYTTNILADPNTNTMYTTPGTYTVTMTATNATGCTSVSTLLVIVTEAFTITIPNVFTPNGDGVNDYFFVKSTGLAAIEMVIYDRWGLKLWESTSATGTWDGKNSNDGTYFYVIKATSTKSQTTEYKGPLLLIK